MKKFLIAASVLCTISMAAFARPGGGGGGGGHHGGGYHGGFRGGYGGGGGCYILSSPVTDGSEESVPENGWPNSYNIPWIYGHVGRYGYAGGNSINAPDGYSGPWGYPADNDAWWDARFHHPYRPYW